jgi:hypothetical protein
VVQKWDYFGGEVLCFGVVEDPFYFWWDFGFSASTEGRGDGFVKVFFVYAPFRSCQHLIQRFSVLHRWRGMMLTSQRTDQDVRGSPLYSIVPGI